MPTKYVHIISIAANGFTVCGKLADDKSVMTKEMVPKNPYNLSKVF